LSGSAAKFGRPSFAIWKTTRRSICAMKNVSICNGVE
jgi:hypothetical protein